MWGFPKQFGPLGFYAATHLEPALGHEEVVLDALLSKLLGHVQSHGAVLVVDLPLGVIVEDGVGVVDLLELLRRLGVVGVFVRVVLQRQLSAGRGKVRFRARGAVSDQG